MRACECVRCGGQEEHTCERVSVLGVGGGGTYMRACECARCGGQEEHTCERVSVLGVGGRRNIHASV